MQNILLCIGYDGTGFQGYQRQSAKRNARTVQQTLEEALFTLLQKEIKTNSSGRTDAGVHAINQYVNFVVDTAPIPVERISYVLNTILPEDIRVYWSQLMPEDFHARYSAVSRTYYYQIYEGYIPPPTMRLYAHIIPPGIDWNIIQREIQACIGIHDFVSLSAYNKEIENTMREVTGVSIKQIQDGVTRIYITANGFLWKMVRMIVGTSISIALHEKKGKDIASLSEILQANDNRKIIKLTAPAKGLFLYDIKYKEEYGIKSKRHT